MPEDIYLLNDSGGVVLTSGSQPRTGEYPDVGALARAHRAVPWELLQDDPVVLRVVHGPLSAEEESAWVGRFRGRLQLPDGELVLSGGVAWWLEPDDSEFVRVLQVQPGTYDVVVYATRYGVNGDWILESAGVDVDEDSDREDMQPNVDFIVQLLPARGEARLGSRADQGWFHADEHQLDATGELPTWSREALDDRDGDPDGEDDGDEVSLDLAWPDQDPDDEDPTDEAIFAFADAGFLPLGELVRGGEAVQVWRHEDRVGLLRRGAGGPIVELRSLLTDGVTLVTTTDVDDPERDDTEWEHLGQFMDPRRMMSLMMSGDLGMDQTLALLDDRHRARIRNRGVQPVPDTVDDASWFDAALPRG